MYPETQPNPEISVIIPSRDRQDVLKYVLESLNHQTCNSLHYEIIVADDGSDDNTEKVVCDFSNNSTPKVLYIRQQKLGPGAARNAGIAKAKGKYILFLDADLIPEADVVERHLYFHQKSKDEYKCLLGAVRMAPELNRFEQARQNETNIRTTGASLHKVSHWQFRSGNASLPKELCAYPSGFDPRFEAAEDTEFACRLHTMDVSFYYDESIMAYHYHPMSMDEYIEKYAAYGRSVALWYFECPYARRDLALRYGVFAPELPFLQQIKFIIRAILVNRYCVRLIKATANLFKKVYCPLAEMFNKQVVQFYCRNAFRVKLTDLQFQAQKQSIYPVLRRAVT